VIVPVFKTGGRQVFLSPVGSTPTRFRHDTPSAPTYGNLPGLNGYLEMRQLYDAGLSLEQIFKAATINNAREFSSTHRWEALSPARAPISFC